MGVVPGMVKGAYVLGTEFAKAWSLLVALPEVGVRRSLSDWQMDRSALSWEAKVTDFDLDCGERQGFQQPLHDKFKIGGDALAPAGRWYVMHKRRPISACAPSYRPGRGGAAFSQGST